ncbi:hypothetical protein CDL15_Pgr003777 [Punica granatum]|uniref:DUF547 domain-containing protein n=1 Tax=Punica granatum TaxID=22663 RepID=A0A218XT70_PUNGR|nr:hypothetical protein CDL15_Pgr003777 [Punica granatum]
MDSSSESKTRSEECNSVKRDNQDFLPSSSSSLSRHHVHTQHRRSKRFEFEEIVLKGSLLFLRKIDASDRDLDAKADRSLHSRKGQNGTAVSPPSTWARKVQSPLHDPFGHIGKNSVSSQRASLEKDIEQLQSRLQQEKSMRLALERAMGRTSSTLSPGHRHVASKTKELITEIELLEEEVANREQHVLSLYRTIFEQCASQPSSQQSSGVASPAHTKNIPRKHPSIISSAFCSSKNFPLRPLRSLISSDNSEKRSLRKNHALPLSAKTTEVHCEKPYSSPNKIPATERTSMLRTLKDHLYQCPSKLSEEMVRCMVAVYCWLRSTTSIDPAKDRSPLLSRSSTNVVLPRRGIIQGEQFCSSKSMVEISWISTDKRQFSRASYAINNYRMLVEQLERVNVSQMEDNARTAFWINVYNSLIMNVKTLELGYLAYGIPNGSLRRLALFHKILLELLLGIANGIDGWPCIVQAAYNIGGHIVSANAIEQSIFRFHTPRVGWWLETIVSAALRKRSGEERQIISSKFGLPSGQPLVCFALCTGAVSDPALKVYTALNLKEELESARRDFLQANVVVKKSKVFLPKVIERFAREASIRPDDLLSWVIENADRKLHEMMTKCIDGKINRKKASQIIEWLPYCSRFQYVFSKDLTEKPWWV